MNAYTKRILALAMLLNLYLVQGSVTYYLHKLHSFLPQYLQFADKSALSIEKVDAISTQDNLENSQTCDVMSNHIRCTKDWTFVNELSSIGIVDASYLEDALPRLFESALENLGAQLSQEMDKQLDQQIQQWQEETNKKVIARGGQRRLRKFEQIQNLKKQEFLGQYQHIIRDSAKECYGPSIADLDQFQERHDLFGGCLQIKFQAFVEKFVSQALEEGKTYIKENILLLPNQVNMKKAKKKVDVDPYAGKQMDYLSEAEKTMEPHEHDKWLITDNAKPQRLIFGEPIPLEPWEEARWQQFEQWVADNNLRPVNDMFKKWDRWGFTILYLYRFSMGEGATDEEIFKTTHNNLVTIEDYDFPVDPNADKRLLKFIESGSFRMTGKLTELGWEPVLDIDARKFIDVVVHKYKSTPLEAERYWVFWFLWVKTHMMYPGKIERMQIIYDMKDVKVRDIPLMKLQPLLVQMNILFKGGPYRNVFVNQGWFLNKVLQVIAGWFDPYTREIMQFFNEDETFSALLQFQNVDQIEMKYGGNKPQSTQYYPPVY